MQTLMKIPAAQTRYFDNTGGRMGQLPLRLYAAGMSGAVWRYPNAIDWLKRYEEPLVRAGIRCAPQGSTRRLGEVLHRREVQGAYVDRASRHVRCLNLAFLLQSCKRSPPETIGECPLCGDPFKHEGRIESGKLTRATTERIHSTEPAAHARGQSAGGFRPRTRAFIA